MGSRAAVLATALLLSAAAAAAAARDGGVLRLGVDVCEVYSKDECKEHTDKCTPCRAWSKIDVCFETQIARRLPPKLFECDFPPEPPAPQPSPQPSGNETCQDHHDEASCEAARSCVWCLSAAVPSACYTPEEAKRLPAAVFKCKFPSLVLQQ